uniref:uncharacterized protein LOC118528545 isoform X2 n=1 Tax=Halichoerus grypus TaxID=9711 RepID=UPI001659C669|nr:uncharacterized protein LOC118528545 isoform X2 [Halichoerus grypus]
MLFYDWKDPLSWGRGEDGLYHRPPRPRETPPCGARAKCAVIGRGAGLQGERRRRGEGSRSRLWLCDQCLRPGRFSSVWMCTHPAPSVGSMWSALSCGCSSEDLKPRVLQSPAEEDTFQFRLVTFPVLRSSRCGWSSPRSAERPKMQRKRQVLAETHQENTSQHLSSSL